MNGKKRDRGDQEAKLDFGTGCGVAARGRGLLQRDSVRSTEEEY